MAQRWNVLNNFNINFSKKPVGNLDSKTDTSQKMLLHWLCVYFVEYSLNIFQS